MTADSKKLTEIKKSENNSFGQREQIYLLRKNAFLFKIIVTESIKAVGIINWEHYTSIIKMKKKLKISDNIFIES